MTKTEWDGRAPQVGSVAPDPELLDTAGKPASLTSLGGTGPLAVLFIPWPLTARGRQVVRDFRDSTLQLELAGTRVVGISTAEPSALAYLRTEQGLGFTLLSDPDATATSQWGMTGKLGVFLLDAAFHVVLRGDERLGADDLLTFMRRGGVRMRPKPGAWMKKVAATLSRLRATFTVSGSPRTVR